jgi:hypothetical protein
MGAVAHGFDLLTNGAHLIFGSVRLHHNQHVPTSGNSKFIARSACAANQAHA